MQIMGKFFCRPPKFSHRHLVVVGPTVGISALVDKCSVELFHLKVKGLMPKMSYCYHAVTDSEINQQMSKSCVYIYIYIFNSTIGNN